MKVLVLGSGGREHALVWKLAQSPHIAQMWCAPGNAGISEERLAKNGSLVECVNISAEDLPKLLAFAQEKQIDFTVVGPDGSLALGVVDLPEEAAWDQVGDLVPVHPVREVGQPQRDRHRALGGLLADDVLVEGGDDGFGGHGGREVCWWVKARSRVQRKGAKNAKGRKGEKFN